MAMAAAIARPVSVLTMVSDDGGTGSGSSVVVTRNAAPEAPAANPVCRRTSESGRPKASRSVPLSEGRCRLLEKESGAFGRDDAPPAETLSETCAAGGEKCPLKRGMSCVPYGHDGRRAAARPASEPPSVCLVHVMNRALRLGGGGELARGTIVLPLSLLPRACHSLVRHSDAPSGVVRRCMTSRRSHSRSTPSDAAFRQIRVVHVLARAPRPVPKGTGRGTRGLSLAQSRRPRRILQWSAAALGLSSSAWA